MENKYFVSTISEIDDVIIKMEMAGVRLPINSELSLTISKDDFKNLPLPVNIITSSVTYVTKLGIKVRINSYGK